MLYKVSLELASCREFPNGNRECRYELLLPLTADLALDYPGWRQSRRNDIVRRRWHDGEEVSGSLQHESDFWILAFGWGFGRKEAFVRDEDDRFAVGQEIPIVEFDGRTSIFRVVETEPL